MTAKRPPADPFAKMDAAIATADDEELKTLMELRAEFPPRGAPMTISGPRGEALDEVEPGRWKEGQHIDRYTGLPPRCPVIPLGLEGDVAWFLNPMGQVVSLKASSSGKGPIDFLFCGLVEYLEWAWPRFGQKGVDGYQADVARCDLVLAASTMGPFDDADRVRGRGAWLDEVGGLIYHAGDRVWFKGRWRAPGLYGDWVFPARPPLPRPSAVAGAGGAGGPGEEALELFETWNWRRKAIDARLLLGWNCMAMLGGALPWRSMVFVTAEHGSGKSTLDAALIALHGRALLPSVSATGPSLYQRLKHDCTPVLLDELEAQAEGSQRRVMDIIALIRTASSGGKINRGSSEGISREYECRSAFLCSAINVPPMNSADRSRYAILQAQPFEPGTPDPQIDLARLATVGQQLLARLIGGWARWDRTLKAFRAALKGAGHDGRAADQFGALIAAEHIARFDADPDQAVLDFWAQALKPDELAETAGKVEDWRQCLLHLVDVAPEALRYRTRLRSVGETLAELRKPRQSALGGDQTSPLEDAESVCRAVGLALSFKKGVAETWENAELFIPGNHPETRKLFAGTTWAGIPGAVGVWHMTLQRAPASLVRVGQCGKGLNQKCHGVFVKLAAAFPEAEPEGERAAA
jgi:hypothetical protein